MRRPSSLRVDRKGIDAAVAVPAIVLVGCLLIVAGMALADSLSSDDADSIRVAKSGDKVAVDYIGKYDNGWVFDTSMWSVADDPDIRKSFDFTKRQQSQYTPLEFTIGEGQLLAKFESAVIGMAVGETRTVSLSASEGYGTVPENELVSHAVHDQIALRKTMNLTEFNDFFGEPAAMGVTVIHPVFGWEVKVDSYSPHLDEVKVKNLPVLGKKYWSYGDADNEEGWYVKVLDITGTHAHIENLVTASMANSVRGVDADGERFFLHAVIDGQMQFKYSAERVGQNLTFTITLKEIIG